MNMTSQLQFLWLFSAKLVILLDQTGFRGKIETNLGRGGHSNEARVGDVTRGVDRVC